MNTSQISLSSLQTPGAIKINPYCVSVEAETEAIISEYNLMLPTFSGYHTMSAYLFPNTTPERLAAIILLNDWLFYIDEQFDRNDGMTANMRHEYFLTLATVIKTGTGADTNDPVQAFAIYLHHVFAELGDPRWLHRFIHNTEDHLAGAAIDIDYLLDDYEGDALISAFIDVRRADSGMKPTCDLIEFAYDIYLPDTAWHNPIVSRARDLCVNIGGLMNDLMSYEKEVIELGSSFNLVALLERSGMSFEDAVDETIRYINVEMTQFNTLKAHIPEDDDVLLYYQGLADQITAAYHWQFATMRYKSATSPFIELRTNTL